MLAKIYPSSFLEGTVAAPPSKNYTSRYIWLAALTQGETRIDRPALNDDARSLILACRQLGAQIFEDQERLIVRGFGHNPRPIKELNPGNGGLVLRLLLALGVWLPDVTYRTDFIDSLGKRPQGDLLKALESLEVDVESNDGRLPIRLQGHGVTGGTQVAVSGGVSSQFATALLLVAPLFPLGLSLRVVDGLRSRPPLETTLEVMSEAGVTVNADWERLIFTVAPGQRYKAGIRRVPGDYPAAAALFAAAAILPSRVRVEELYEDAQGERAIISGLIEMGADLKVESGAVEIRGGKALKGVQFNGDKATDGVLALSAAAAYAQGETRFYGVGNLRFKESDRIGDFGNELHKIGIRMDAKSEEFTVIGAPQGYLGGVEIEAHHDHRIIMAATVIALRTERGLTIRGAEHVSKSYPNFFDDLRTLGAKIELVEE
jgi:3-phosphoshikimate 1-carboxyvinyltransferase